MTLLPSQIQNILAEQNKTILDKINLFQKQSSFSYSGANSFDGDGSVSNIINANTSSNALQIPTISTSINRIWFSNFFFVFFSLLLLCIVVADQMPGMNTCITDEFGKENIKLEAYVELGQTFLISIIELKRTIFYLFLYMIFFK